MAAAIQSVFYGGAVSSGSLFALAQSAAMGGIAVGTATEVAAGAVALGTGATMLAKGSKKDDSKKDDEGK